MTCWAVGENPPTGASPHRNVAGRELNQNVIEAHMNYVPGKTLQKIDSMDVLQYWEHEA